MAGVGANRRCSLSLVIAVCVPDRAGRRSTSSPPSWSVLARRTGSRWIDPVVEAVARRVPFWSVLVGIYIAAGFWILPAKIAIALDKALYVIAAASFTFLVSEVLVKFVRIHGPVLDPSQPTTTLTENLVRIVVVIARPARHPGRARPADYADSDGARRRRSRCRARAAGHARESVCGLLSDGRQSTSASATTSSCRRARKGISSTSTGARAGCGS